MVSANYYLHYAGQIPKIAAKNPPVIQEGVCLIHSSQLLKNLREILGQVCFDTHFLSRYGMNENKRRCVEHLSIN